MIENKNNFVWLDNCKNNGSYYNQFPQNNRKEYCEILENKDFFEYEFIKQNENEELIICSNPPYHLLDKWFKKCIDLNPKYMSFLIGNNNLTCKRMELFKNNGYKLKQLHYCKVFKWFGMSNIVLYKKTEDDISQKISFDRKVWRSYKALA